jgi:hypothetical protein
MITTLAVLPLLLAAVADGPAARGTASGRFAASASKTYAVAHAVAWLGRSYVSVVLSDEPFDVAAMGKDGVFDDSDLMAHAGVSLTLNLDPATRAYVGLRTRDQAGSGADFRCEDPSMLTLTRADATHLAGTFKCEEHDVTFDAPILKVPSAR